VWREKMTPTKKHITWNLQKPLPVVHEPPCPVLRQKKKKEFVCPVMTMKIKHMGVIKR